MATMKEMAAEYRVAAAKLAMRIEQKKAVGATDTEIASLQRTLNDIRKIQRLLDGYYTTPRTSDFVVAGRLGEKDDHAR